MSSPPSVESHESAATKNLAPALEARRGTAMCLSGGGYRAALFHLGACRRLNELGILSVLNAVSSVSGGSIFAAHLAKAIVDSNGGCFAQYERDIAQPFRAFVKNDIRTTPALKRLLPWEWANAGAGAEALQEQYERLLVPGMKIGDLPDELHKPRFHFCATELAYGVNWVFRFGKVGDYQVGYLDKHSSNDVPLALAVAASSCFPPVFRPLPLSLDPRQLSVLGKVPAGDARDSCIRQLALCDGGVYDNMGLEPVWKSYATLFISDGGKPFTFAKETDSPHQLYRIHDVMANQAEALRKRWLIASFLRTDYEGAYFGVSNSVNDYPTTGVPGYSKEFAESVITKIRTDMDVFSDTEIAVLENHGYTLAEAAHKAYVRQAGAQVAPLTPPNQHWPGGQADSGAFEDTLRAQLADSSHVHLFGH